MASQVWRSGRDVDRVLWKHWMHVYVPRSVETDTALLFVTGGDESPVPPQDPVDRLVEAAGTARAVTAVLYNVPNQPLRFLADPEFRARTEDGILAFAWARFRDTRDPEWLGLLPMVKSAVRAMDTVSAFTAGIEDCPAVKHFVVAGASKRGWTAWLTAAVDRRVVGVAPIVIDVLNMRPSIKHQREAYGRFSHALGDYVENRIVELLDAPDAEAALAIIDPWQYRSRYTMPKLILNSTGDQFFLPDSWRFYWDDLPDPKFLRYVPNTNHGLNDSAYDTLITFFTALVRGIPLPVCRWTVEAPGRIRVETRDRPASVLLWQATNPGARDFRLETIGSAWKSTPLAESAPGVYVAEVRPPVKGWTAFMVEVTWPDPVRPGKTFTLTSGVSVVPDTLPFADNADAIVREQK